MEGEWKGVGMVALVGMEVVLVVVVVVGEVVVAVGIDDVLGGCGAELACGAVPCFLKCVVRDAASFGDTCHIRTNPKLW